MPERTAAFEAYLKDLENKKVSPRGADKKAGKLIVSSDELGEDAEDKEVDAAV